MGRQASKELDALNAKLEASYVTIKRLEAETDKLRRRLQAKAKEVADARQSRKEALNLLNLAATDPAVRDRAIALLAADALNEKQREALLAQEAAQTSIPGTEVAA